MSCRDFHPRVAWRRRNREPPAGYVDCDNCSGDGVVSGSCSCGRCESPPDVACPDCDGDGYVTFEQAGQACHFCGELSTAIIHHKVEGEINVCSACHIEASDADEIENIPTKLL